MRENDEVNHCSPLSTEDVVAHSHLSYARELCRGVHDHDDCIHYFCLHLFVHDSVSMIGTMILSNDSLALFVSMIGAIILSP